MDNEEKMKMQEQIEMQLHEQYAKNNNANVSSIVTLFVTMLASVGAYGYVFLHSENLADFENEIDLIMQYNSGKFSFVVLLVVAIAAIVVLMMIAYICVSLGCRQRKEQFIIYAIRRKYYYGDMRDTKIYPNRYDPFGKRGLKMVQSPYDYFIRCIMVAIFLIALSLLFRFMAFYPQLMLWLMLSGVLIAGVVSFFFLFSNSVQSMMLCKWEKEIMERENEYASIKPKDL